MSRLALTDFLVANLILSIQGFNRQMNALQNAFSHSNKVKVTSVQMLTFWFTSHLPDAGKGVCCVFSRWVNWARLDGSGCMSCYFSLCFVLFPCILFCFFPRIPSLYFLTDASSDLGFLVSVDFFQTGFCDEGLYCINKSDF